MEEAGDGLRTRSFRNEDYNNRRVFLRSYPLQFDNNNDEDSQLPPATPTHDSSTDRVRNRVAGIGEFAEEDKNLKKKNLKKKKEAMKKMVVTIVEWGGGRIVVLRRFKHKISYYVVACFPINVFKPVKALISAR